MTPEQLRAALASLIDHELRASVMIWGPPGIGKSSIVARLARDRGMAFADLRLSQLAPTDLRGLPVPGDGISRWFPPEFLPRDDGPEGHGGVLFLDELNMAPPTLQGIAHQLILDRRVGSYTLPPQWFVWAAGNRKEDRASVFHMPAPLANRFLHFEVEPDFASFRSYALAAGIDEQILAFLAWRTELLHKLDPDRPAWPSPRTWELASRLHGAGLPVSHAVGEGAGAEFTAFLQVYGQLVDLDRILAGRGGDIRFPAQPSERYAAVVGLGMRPVDAEQAMAGLSWVVAQATQEWLQLLVSYLLPRAQARGFQGPLLMALRGTPEWKAVQEAIALMAM